VSKRGKICCAGVLLLNIGIWTLKETGKLDVCSSWQHEDGTYSATQHENRLFSEDKIRIWYGEILDPCKNGFILRKHVEAGEVKWLE
jgi:hypothetical protein